MRRRIQAVPIPGASSSFAIGVTMTPLVATTPAATGTAGVTDPVGPMIFITDITLDDIGAGEGGGDCSWIAIMSGIGSGADVVWSLSWSDMEISEGAVLHGAFSDSTIGIVTTNSAIYWIDVTCTVNGVAYTTRIGKEEGSEELINYACAF